MEKSYTDPITGKFAPGNPGRPPGTRNFQTDFDEVVEEIAKANSITTSEARKILIKKAYSEAKNGVYPFYKDIFDRYYGKAKENIDVNMGGELNITNTPIPLEALAIIEEDLRKKKLDES